MGNSRLLVHPHMLAVGLFSMRIRFKKHSTENSGNSNAPMESTETNLTPHRVLTKLLLLDISRKSGHLGEGRLHT